MRGAVMNSILRIARGLEGELLRARWVFKRKVRRVRWMQPDDHGVALYIS